MSETPEHHPEINEKEEACPVTTDERCTLRLSKKAIETIDWIAKQRGDVNRAEVIRRALGTERLLLEQQNQGFTIILEKPGFRDRELMLR